MPVKAVQWIQPVSSYLQTIVFEFPWYAVAGQR